MEFTARDTECIQKRMQLLLPQLLLPQLLRRERSAASIDEEQVVFEIVPLEMSPQPCF
jgi:hypothetical protein